ncbi:hypothetical protein DFJ77DRAFT_118539 [Powellomyces hirtus]|nr:hypothetical protein DFJ77DRAFT_118539 [Powellomyces hirtus]
MIACKIAETHPPSCRELSDLSGGAFPPSGLRVMELWILTVLSWNLNPPTPHMFLDYFLDLFLFKTEVKMSLFTVANQYLDLIQREYEFVAYRPSVQAAAALKCTLRGEGYTNFHDVMAHELDRQSLQPAVLISSISIPRMVDIDACASAITVKVGPYAISRMHPSHCTANPAPTHATRVKNGLATPVNYQEVCKSVSHDDRGTALSKKRPASRAMNEIRKRAAPYPTPTEQQEAPIFEEPSSPFS